MAYTSSSASPPSPLPSPVMPIPSRASPQSPFAGSRNTLTPAAKQTYSDVLASILRDEGPPYRSIQYNNAQRRNVGAADMMFPRLNSVGPVNGYGYNQSPTPANAPSDDAQFNFLVGQSPTTGPMASPTLNTILNFNPPSPLSMPVYPQSRMIDPSANTQFVSGVPMSYTQYHPYADASSSRDAIAYSNGNNKAFGVPTHTLPISQLPAPIRPQTLGYYSPNKRKDAFVRKIACAPCHAAKTSCNGERPCDRCIRLSRQPLCQDRMRKQPRRAERKKVGGDAESTTNTADDASETSPMRNLLFPARMSTPSQPSPLTSSPRSVATSVATPPPPLPPPPQPPPASQPLQQHISVPILSTMIPPSASSASNAAVALSPNSSSGQSSNMSDSGSEESVAVGNSDAQHGWGMESDSERLMSQNYLRMHQLNQTRRAIIYAVSKNAVTFAAVHFFLAYLYNTMHPDDFKNLIHPLNDGNNTYVQLPVELIGHPNTPFVPRFVFNWGSSPLEAMDDSIHNVDFAVIYIVRVEKDEAEWSNYSGKSILVQSRSGGGEVTTPVEVTITSANSTEPPVKHETETAMAVDTTRGEAEENTQTSTATPFASASSAFTPVTSTSSSGSMPFAPLSTLITPGITEVLLQMRVNREFERLFGYSQRQMRDMWVRESGKVIYRLLSPAYLPLLSKWLTEAMMGGRTSFSATVEIRNRWHGTTKCLFNCRYTLDANMVFKQCVYAYTPMPD